MIKEFGFTRGSHLVSAFRAFVHDNGMPGVRLTKENGDYVDVVFSVPGLQELQKQLTEAARMAKSRSIQ
jgi:hypothetical protein